MCRRTALILMLAGAAVLTHEKPAHAWRGGFGGFHGGGFGGFSSFHAGGFGGGYGSVHYGGYNSFGGGGFAHDTGFSTGGLGDASHYGGWGGYHSDSGAWGGYHSAYTERPSNYGSIQHYNADGYRAPGTYGGWGHAVQGPAGNGAAVYHGPNGGTAAAYRGPFTSGAAVRGPAGNAAGAVRGPAGGVVAGYRGPYSSGAVAVLPSGYTAAAWHGGTYYHSGYYFYKPYWYAGSLTYMPVFPPTGWFFATLPDGATQTIINNNTYYSSGGVYYQQGSQNGQSGYNVVDPPAGAPAAPPPPPSISPFEPLKKMSDYLDVQKHVAMTINETFDEVALPGQKIQLSSIRIVRLQRPDKLKININGQGLQRVELYNGATFTILDIIGNVYASVAMTGSIDSALDQMGKQYSMAEPMDDLLYSDIYSRLAPKVQAGQYLGAEQVASVTCDHLAFTQTGLDWEIWIAQGAQPAPRKLVMTYVTLPGRPQYTLLITSWATPESFADGEFNLQLPDTAATASMLSLTGQSTAE